MTDVPVRNSEGLQQPVVDGNTLGDPKDPASVMFPVHASNRVTLSLAALGVFGTVAVLLAVHYYWQESVPAGGSAPTVPTEFAALRMVVLMGCLGGFLHFTSSLAKYVGNRQLLRSWAFYYLLMPIEGAALAPVIYLLLRVGVLSPGASAQNGTENLNLVGIYGFAALSGLFSKQAIDMLAQVFTTIFTKIKSKDGL